jgi:hypothetical protein
MIFIEPDEFIGFNFKKLLAIKALKGLFTFLFQDLEFSDAKDKLIL